MENSEVCVDLTCNWSPSLKFNFLYGHHDVILAKKFLQVAQIFTKQSKGNEGHTNMLTTAYIWSGKYSYILMSSKNTLKLKRNSCLFQYSMRFTCLHHLCVSLHIFKVFIVIFLSFQVSIGLKLLSKCFSTRGCELFTQILFFGVFSKRLENRVWTSRPG